MSALEGKRILQVGFGGFGPVHLQAWMRVGRGGALWIADPDPAARGRALAFNLSPERVVADLADVLDRVDLVDVVAPSLLQADLCARALAAGKDVFCEKPLTLDVATAERLEALVRQSGRVLQIGYYFRHHPLARAAKARVRAGEIGALRYLSGTFAGFKRARRDIGVTASDAVHFLDLFNWLTGAFPHEVFAVQRDHFGRGLEDLSLVLLRYPGDVVAKLEAGLIQPGRRTDTVMPDARTTKEVQVCGAAGAIEIDFQAERLILHRVRHELQDGLWRPVFGDALIPHASSAGAVDILESQFCAFLRHVETRTEPEANVRACGVEVARTLEAIRVSAQKHLIVNRHPSS